MITEKQRIYGLLQKLSDSMADLSGQLQKHVQQVQVLSTKVTALERRGEDAWLDKPADEGQPTQRSARVTDALKERFFDAYNTLRQQFGDSVTTWALAERIRTALGVDHSQNTIHRHLIALGAPKDGKAPCALHAKNGGAS